MRGEKPGMNVQLTEIEIKGLCLKSREIFLSQPILLELEAPLKICGKFIMCLPSNSIDLLKVRKPIFTTAFY